MGYDFYLWRKNRLSKLALFTSYVKMLKLVLFSPLPLSMVGLLSCIYVFFIDARPEIQNYKIALFWRAPFGNRAIVHFIWTTRYT